MIDAKYVNILQGKKHLHFIGIGGSGMYPLVQILHSRGFYITGSDNNDGDTLNAERKMGIPITLGHDAKNLGDADLVVYTAAIRQDNPELVYAKEHGIPVVERATMLGLVTRHYENAICVCGTHGKTTTTAMLTQIMMRADMDPSAVIGGKLPLIGGNGRVGNSEIMVCEACEFCDHFLQLYPDTVVVLNIDEDHLEYFKNLDNIIRSFHTFCKMATLSIIVNGDDANSMKAVEGIEKPITTFGYGENNDYVISNVRPKDGVTTLFDLSEHGTPLGTFVLGIPGKHNVLNAAAAIISALNAGADVELVKLGLSEFHGAGRRFEVLAKINGITIADDYAHHPTELTATLKTAKELPFRKVWAVFQPFTYSRTAILLDDFAKALSIADHVVMSEIMGAREVNTYDIYTKDLAEKIDGSVWFPTFEEIADYVVEHAQPGDLVITLGCGDIYKAAKLMIQKLS